MRALIASLALVCAACAAQTGPAAPAAETMAPAPAPDYAAAVADPGRPAADVERDALRHPAAILAFAGVSPGQHIVDLGAGGGYYTRLFSTVVGAQGRVTAIIRPPRPEATERPRIYAVSEDPRYANVVVNANGYVIALDQPADAIFVSQIYHDFYLPQLAIDPAAATRAMYDALKPGGALIIIDHSAAAGSPVPETASTLHRIDEAAVVRDMQAAGFVLEADDQTLRNPADDRAIRVFEGDIRGRTDQFVLRFRKPG